MVTCAVWPGASTTVAGVTTGLRVAGWPIWLPDGPLTQDTPG